MRVVSFSLFLMVLLACILVSCTMAERAGNVQKAGPSKKTVAAIKKMKEEDAVKQKSRDRNNQEEIGKRTFKFNIQEMLLNSLCFFGCIAVTHFIVTKCVTFYNEYKLESKPSPSSSSYLSSTLSFEEVDTQKEENVMPAANNDSSLVQKKGNGNVRDENVSIDTSGDMSSVRSESRSTLRSRSSSRRSARVYADNTVTPPSSARSNSRSSTVQNTSENSKPRGRSVSRSPKQSFPTYTEGTKFYVKLITWYTKPKDCPFPNAEDWYVEGFVKAVGNKGMHDIVFPVFNDKEILTMKPSYFQRHAIFENPTRIVTKKDLDKYDDH